MMKIVCICAGLVCFFIVFISPHQETETHFHKNRSVAKRSRLGYADKVDKKITAVQLYLVAVNPYAHVQTRSHCKYAYIITSLVGGVAQW